MWNWRQRFFYWVLVPAAVLLAVVRDWKIAFTAITFILCGFYGAVIFFRLLSVLMALLKSSEHRVSDSEVAALRDEDLPVYTILVPMYKEPEVAQKIARTVTSLNYPIDKLDVKLLLEEDDAETRAKVAEVYDSLPPCVEVINAPIVPKGQPRTKPRACNWGLENARGKYLVIFDAEDQPEADQLKKAVVVFRKLEEAGKDKVVCLQAKLNYFNARQNWLTSFFTLEYTTWFDLFLPGLHAVRTPIPLGGTSNHFKTDVLQKVGGWDPFNVTEDCDLGIRLARQGCSTEVLDSTTWEEANCEVRNWIRQRSRWIKGYYQTHLVHTRDSFVPPLILAAVFTFLAWASIPGQYQAEMARYVAAFKWTCLVLGGLSAAMAIYSFLNRMRKRFTGNGSRSLGLWSALTFRFTVGGLSVMLLMNIFFWLMTTGYLLREPIADNLPEAVGNYQLESGASVRETVRGWKLYYDEVTNERFRGATFWNTGSAFVSGNLSSEMAAEQIRAIDTWSLVSQLFYPVAVMLFAANFIIVLLGLISCAKRNLWDLLPFALLMPFYWVLISIAAYKGFFQLFTNPWYWEKTQHGLAHNLPPAPPPPVEGPVSSAAGE